MLCVKAARYRHCFHGVGKDPISPSPMNTITLFPMYIWYSFRRETRALLGPQFHFWLKVCSYVFPITHLNRTGQALQLCIQPLETPRNFSVKCLRHYCINMLSTGREKAKKQEAMVEIRHKNSPKKEIKFILSS